MIAIAIFFTNQNKVQVVASPTTADSPLGAKGVPAPITDADFIRGNPNAPIAMVMYSDYDCPFCQQFHATMQQILDEYNTQVAWVYRQFPLAQLHPNSPKISEAALCVGKIGGQKAFWEFSDALYQSRNVDEATNMTKLADFAAAGGVSEADLVTCMASGEMQEVVVKSIEEGYNAGVRSTPHTILMVGDQQAVISGAQPYTVVKGIVQNLVDQLGGVATPATEPNTNVPVTEAGVPLLE